MSKHRSLDFIGLQRGTDKSSSGHNYLNFYESFFSSRRDGQLKILEVGIFNGASLNTWADYFVNSVIVGADINPDCQKYARDNIYVELLDQSNVEELTRLAVKYGPFDIIIEDGSHMWEHQITTLRTLFPFVINKGLYIVEDLQTNYGSDEVGYRGLSSIRCIDYLKKWLDLLVAHEQAPLDEVEDAFLRTYGQSAEFIAFRRHTCIIQKNYRPNIRDASPGAPLIEELTDSYMDPIEILAHVSYRGDVVGKTGFVNSSHDDYSIQGFAIVCDKALQYRVRRWNGTWSDWVENGKFAGSRGESMRLTGFAVRLTDEWRESYSLRVAGRFAGSSEIREVKDGEDCISESDEALVGLQVVLV